MCLDQQSRLGELLSVTQVLKGETERSKLSCDRSVAQFLESWQQLDPLSHHLRASHLLRLHSLMDTLVRLLTSLVYINYFIGLSYDEIFGIAEGTVCFTLPF